MLSPPRLIGHRPPRGWRPLVWALGACLLAGTAQALTITTQGSDLGGTRYRYDYTVFNDRSLGSGVSLSVFDLLFDPLLYDETSLTLASSQDVTTDWAEAVLFSAPEVPAAYDVSALAGGLAPGATLGGLAVTFIWPGVGTTPTGIQPFEVYDPDTFLLLATGRQRLQRCR